jgi:hypothetical protein
MYHIYGLDGVIEHITEKRNRVKNRLANNAIGPSVYRMSKVERLRREVELDTLNELLGEFRLAVLHPESDPDRRAPRTVDAP